MEMRELTYIHLDRDILCAISGTKMQNFPVFSLLAGNLGGERFAVDSIHRHTLFEGDIGISS
jgi:hypothetical protein